MPDSWYYDDFASNAEVPSETSLAASIAYNPGAPAPCATAGDCDCVSVGETRGFLFFVTAPGTLSPEVPTPILPAANWEVLLKGFGLPVPIEATVGNGKLAVNESTGRILATFDEDDADAMLPNSFGTVELWLTTPVRACLARRRYKAYP